VCTIYTYYIYAVYTRAEKKALAVVTLVAAMRRGRWEGGGDGGELCAVGGVRGNNLVICYISWFSRACKGMVFFVRARTSLLFQLYTTTPQCLYLHTAHTHTHTHMYIYNTMLFYIYTRIYYNSEISRSHIIIIIIITITV
jgi:hypothetical protein